MEKINNFHDFVVAVYKYAVPSVDFDSAESIDCTKHRLKISKYEEILSAFAGENDEMKCGCNMFMLQSGPQLEK